MLFYIITVVAVILGWLAINKLEDRTSRAVIGIIFFGAVFYLHDIGRTVMHSYERDFYRMSILNMKETIEQEKASALIEPLEQFEKEWSTKNSYSAAMDLSQSTWKIIEQNQAEPAEALNSEAAPQN